MDSRWLRRRKIALEGIDVSQLKGIEYGPLDKPLVLKSQGEVSYVDYATKQELVAHYAKESAVNTSAIQEVDVVLKNQTLDQVIPPKSVDYIVACHVAEHVPDFIGWLKQLSLVLRDGGYVSLIIPDKRFVFDCQRSLTKPSDLLNAHMESYQRPSAGQIFGYLVNYCPTKTRMAWLGLQRRGQVSSVTKSLSPVLHSARTGDYFNVHCWVWTPISFLLNFKVLCELGLTDFALESFVPTALNDMEFFVRLRKISETESDRCSVQFKSLPNWIHDLDPTDRTFERLNRVGLWNHTKSWISLMGPSGMKGLLRFASR